MLLVQCDFDDTITVGNVSTAIREAFGPVELRSMEEEYQAGRYSVEESNIRQFALVRATREEISEYVLAHVVVRDGFREFVDYCRGKRIRMVVVSSGLDLYIEPTLTRLGLAGLEAYSGKAHATPSGIRIEYTDPSGTVITRGFKESFTRGFKRSGHTVIYVGDGISDIVPAGEADFAIARSVLQRHLDDNGTPCYAFENFADVRKHVGDICRLISP